MSGHSRPRSDLRQGLGEGFFRHLGVIGRLRPQPIAVGKTEEPAQAQVGIRRDGTLAPHDLTDPLGGHTDFLGEAVLREAHRDQELFAQQLAGRQGLSLRMVSLRQ
jgi:hypothetical protein